MFGVDGGLACRTKRNLVGRNVIQNVENGQSPPSGQGAAEVLHRASGLELASRNRVDDEPDLGLEYTARYALEQNLGFIAFLNPLQAVLLERGCQRAVSWAVVHENHDWTERRRDHIHARPQRDLRNKSASGRSDDGLVEIILSIGKLVLQTHDGRVFAVDCRAISLPGAIFRGGSLGHAVVPQDSPREAVDPVCGMTVTIGPATEHLQLAGAGYWFCGPGCSTAFANRPAGA